MKIGNSKKGTENWVPDTIFFWMFFAIILGFTVIAFLWVTTPFVARYAEIPEGVETHILLERFFNSPDCFIYINRVIGRSYQKVIDWDKFTDENMKKCYQTEHKDIIAFKLTLSFYGETKSVQTPNWREGYMIKEPQVKDILVKSGDEIYKTRMIIYIQNER